MAGARASSDRPRRRSRLARIGVWTGRILALLILLPILGIAILVGRVWLGQPDLDGRHAVPGLDGDVRVARDAKGVVHIEAASERDAYVALGFVHAQDRFFQMDAMRRLASGRLAEIAGPPALQFDVRMRALGLRWLAEGDVQVLSPEATEIYQAFAEGVNAWLERRHGVAADELALLLAPEPEPWRIADSLAWNRLMSLRLVGNWASELMRLRLARTLSPEQIADLWPGYPAAGPLTYPDVADSVLAAARRAAAMSNPDDGSNGWVVAAERSASGHALLANDPHLGLTAPGTWMLVSLKAPGFRLAGASAPGVPAVILGHNGRIAWGLTNAETDASDVYVETVDPADPDRYLAPDGPRPFETRQETIKVRFGRDREVVVRRTRHGPVVSDELDGAPEGTALALAHTGLLPHEASAEAIFRVNRARDWAEFRQALAHAQAPQQNAFYAGPDGVGLVTMATLPIRRKATGYMPADGRTTDGDWIGFAGVDAMPQTFRPARGWAANANNKLAADDYPIRLGQEWGYPGRIARIEEILAAGGPFDLDALQALQLDDRSTIARALLPTMLAAVADAGLSKTAQGLVDRLATWDGRTGADAIEPLVFYAWVGEAIRRIFADELGPEFDGWFGLRAEPLGRALGARKVWCDDTTTSAAENCGEMLARAIEDAAASLQARYGDDPRSWRWGDAHRARFRHLPFGLLPVVRDIFNVELPAPGGQETVNRAAFRISDAADPFVAGHGPGLRALYDLADLEASRFVIGPGQSGRLFSPNRADMAGDWRDGRYVSLAPIADPVHLLVLEPGAPP